MFQLCFETVVFSQMQLFILILRRLQVKKIFWNWKHKWLLNKTVVYTQLSLKCAEVVYFQFPWEWLISYLQPSKNLLQSYLWKKNQIGWVGWLSHGPESFQIGLEQRKHK